jgi:hypothetical protein
MKSLLIILLVLLPTAVVRADCGRLEAGDSYQKINQILECLESQINDLRNTKATAPSSPSGDPVSAEQDTGGKEQEANNQITEANLIRIGQRVQGRLANDKDRDFYKFKTPVQSANAGQQKFRVILRKLEQSHVRIDIYDDVENKIKSDAAPGDETVSMLVESKPDSYYYVLVKSWDYHGIGTKIGAYELVIREEE